MKNEIPRAKDETRSAPGGAFRRAFVSFFEFRPSFFIRGFEFRSSNLAVCNAYISSSGEGGSRLHRWHFGEDLENVAGASEHHWMAGNFIKYASILTPNDLPVDSHELIVLCSPMPVFLGSGETKGDGRADAAGTFLAGVGGGAGV